MNITQKRNAFIEDSVRGLDLIRLFGLLPDVSFFIKDREGHFMALNPRGCDYCGVSSQEEAFGKTDLDFFPKRRAAEYRSDDERVMDSGEAIINRVEAAPEQMGSPRLVLTSKVPLHGRQGEVIGIAGVSRAIEHLAATDAQDTRFTEIVKYIHAHYGDELRTPQFATMAGMSVSAFERSFREAFGTSPHKYVMRIRMEAAARQLLTSRDTVTTIAQNCGFHDHAHLSRYFSRMMGMSPTKYRQRQRGQEANFR